MVLMSLDFSLAVPGRRMRRWPVLAVDFIASQQHAGTPSTPPDFELINDIYEIEYDETATVRAYRKKQAEAATAAAAQVGHFV